MDDAGVAVADRPVHGDQARHRHRAPVDGEDLFSPVEVAEQASRCERASAAAKKSAWSVNPCGSVMGSPTATRGGESDRTHERGRYDVTRSRWYCGRGSAATSGIVCRREAMPAAIAARGSPRSRVARMRGGDLVQAATTRAATASDSRGRRHARSAWERVKKSCCRPGRGTRRSPTRRSRTRRGSARGASRARARGDGVGGVARALERARVDRDDLGLGFG